MSVFFMWLWVRAYLSLIPFPSHAPTPSLDLIGSIIVFSIAGLNVALAGRTSPALVALALSEAIDLTSFLNYAVKVHEGALGGRT